MIKVRRAEKKDDRVSTSSTASSSTAVADDARRSSLAARLRSASASRTTPVQQKAFMACTRSFDVANMYFDYMSDVDKKCTLLRLQRFVSDKSGVVDLSNKIRPIPPWRSAVSLRASVVAEPPPSQSAARPSVVAEMSALPLQPVAEMSAPPRASRSLPVAAPAAPMVPWWQQPTVVSIED